MPSRLHFEVLRRGRLTSYQPPEWEPEEGLSGGLVIHGSIKEVSLILAAISATLRTASHVTHKEDEGAEDRARIAPAEYPFRSIVHSLTYNKKTRKVQ
jgi:hypothetical protein